MWRGARRKRRYGKTDHRQNPPAYRRRDGGGETKKDELMENTGAKTRKTKDKTLPQATIVAEGGETRGENQHKMERWHNPQSREGGEMPSRTRISKEKTKQRASQRKEDKTYGPVLLCE